MPLKSGDEVTQFHLVGSGKSKGYSGRGVRMRTLSPREKDAVAVDAAKQAGPEGTTIDYTTKRLREGVTRAIVAVTKPDAKAEDLGKPESWTPVNTQALQMPSPQDYDALFSTKDDDVICGVFRQLHDAPASDLEAILGKALTVCMD